MVIGQTQIIGQVKVVMVRHVNTVTCGTNAPIEMFGHKSFDYHQMTPQEFLTIQLLG
jgi:glutamyl-tRNA reductase